MKCEAPAESSGSFTSGSSIRKRRDTLPSPAMGEADGEDPLGCVARARRPRPVGERRSVECWNADWHESLLGVACAEDPTSAPSNTARPVTGPLSARIDALLAQRVAEPRDPADYLLARSELVERERHALLELLRHGSAIAIGWRVARLTARLESSRGSDTVALETLLLLDTPEHLVPFAERLLSEDILVGPYVDRVLRHTACARALWKVRFATETISRVHRARFVGWMLAMGDVARVVLLDALVMLAPHAATSCHSSAIEDLLAALPVSCDDALLASVREFERSPVARVRDLTRSAIARART